VTRPQGSPPELPDRAAESGGTVAPRRDSTSFLVGAALVLWVVAKGLFSWGRYFNQDEFEYLHQGWLLHVSKLQYLDFNSNHPPFFFELVSRLNLFITDPVALLRAGRLLTLASSGVQLFLVWAIARAVFGARAGRWALIVYATSATFIEWSIEIRSDALMVPLWLAAVFLLLTPARMRNSYRLFAIGLFLGSAFWSNQKVAYLALPIGVFLLLGGSDRAWRPLELGWVALGALLPTAVCFSSAAVAGNLAELLRHNFAGAAALAAADPYRQFRPLVLRHLVSRDTGLIVLAALAAGWAVVRWRDQTRSGRYVLLAALWGAATFLLTPGPFHYYLLSVLPLVAVLVAGFLATRDRLQASAWRSAVLLLLLLVAPLIRMVPFVAPTNEFQLQVIRLGTALTTPATPVFDGAGILVQRPDAYGFHWVLWSPEVAKYRRGELPPAAATVRSGGGRLVLLTYRVLALPGKDLRDLLRQFPRLWGPICVPGFDSGPPALASPASLSFELWYEGDYEVFPQGAWIDGRPVEGLVHLNAGEHDARLPEGEHRIVVRDASYRKKIRLPAEPLDWRVFGDYGYTY